MQQCARRAWNTVTLWQGFARVIARDVATWSKVVKAGNIRID